MIETICRDPEVLLLPELYRGVWRSYITRLVFSTGLATTPLGVVCACVCLREKMRATHTKRLWNLQQGQRQRCACVCVCQGDERRWKCNAYLEKQGNKHNRTTHRETTVHVMFRQCQCQSLSLSLSPFQMSRERVHLYKLWSVQGTRVVWFTNAFRWQCTLGGYTKLLGQGEKKKDQPVVGQWPVFVQCVCVCVRRCHFVYCPGAKGKFCPIYPNKFPFLTLAT